MKSIMKHGILGLVAATAALVLTTQAVASSLWEGEIAAGVGGVYATSSESKLEEYKDLPGGLLGPTGWLSMTQEDKNLKVNFNFPTDNDQTLNAKLGLGAADKLTVKVDYQKYQHLYSETAKSLYTETSPGVFRLDDNLQLANQTANSSQQFNNLVAAEAGTLPSTVKFTDTVGGGDVAYRLMPNLKLEINGKVKIRQGYRPIEVDLGTVEQLTEPLDQRTTDGTVALEWMPKKSVVRLEGGVSNFENGLQAMVWDNPLRLVDSGSSSSQGRMALPPSNLAETSALFISLDQIPKTRVTANAVVGRWYQDVALLPFTINTTATAPGGAIANSTSALPTTSLNGRVDTFSQEYQATVRPIRDLKLMVRARTYEMVNKTAIFDYLGKASTDGNVSGGPLTPEYFGYRKYNFEGQARYDLLKKVGLNLGYDSENFFRTHREFEKTVERTLKGGVDVKPVKQITVGLSGSQAVRSVSQYEAGNWVDSGDMPGLRRYDEANRFRKDLSGDLRVDPIKNLNLSYRYTQGNDDFRPNGDLTGQDVSGAVTYVTQYGLLNDKHVLHSVTGDYQLSDSVGLNALYQRDLFQAVQADTTNGAQDAAHGWQANTEEAYVVYALGLDADLGAGLTSSYLYEHADSIGKVLLNDEAFTANVEGGLPDTTTKKDDYSTKMVLKLDKTWSLVGWYTLEVYKVSDFATQYQGQVLANPATGALIGLFLGDHPSNYVAHIGGVQVAAKF